MPGHVRQRGKRADGSPRWQARWRHPITHERVEKTFRNRDVARRWISAQETAANTGAYVDPRRADRPLSALLDAWRRSWPDRLAPSTQARYDQIIRNYIGPRLGSVAVGALTHEQVQAFLDALRDEGMTPGTLSKVRIVLSAALVEGIRLGLLRDNPARHVRLPSIIHRPMIALTADEVTALATNIDPHFKTLIYTAAYTGMRAGELAALTWTDIHDDRIEVTKSRTQGITGPPKTGRARSISLPPFLTQLLREHRMAQPPATQYIFTMPRGGPLDHKGFYAQHFRPVARAIGQPNVRFHDLRHTCASLLIAAGAHPKAIQERLGHSSITMTMDRYGHWFRSLDAQLTDPLEAAFRASSGSVPGSLKTETQD